MRQTIADAICVPYRLAFRAALAIGLPDSALHPIRRAYVRAIRRANDIYWSEWAAAHGDTNYATRRRVDR